MAEETFGQHIRAARHGYRLSSKHNCYVRIVDEGDRIRVDLAPKGLIPNKIDRETFVIWWDDPSILDSIRELDPYTKDNQVIASCSFYVEAERPIENTSRDPIESPAFKTTQAVLAGVLILQNYICDATLSGLDKMIACEGPYPHRLEKEDIEKLEKLGWEWNQDQSTWVLYT